jgi:DNA-binding transcriptional LysR family regulator
MSQNNFQKRTCDLDMKISDIDAFAAAVRCQSLSQAAFELGITQPAITRRVQNLEEALGVELLDRNTKPPRPTELGWRVHAQCCAILREVGVLRELVAADLPPAGEFRLGLTHGIGELLLIDLLDMLRARWPDLAPRTHTDWGGALLEQLQRQELDSALVFVAREMSLPSQLESKLVMATRLVVVGRRGDWPKRSYRLADCLERGWVLNPDGCGFRANLKRALESQGLPLRVALDTYGRELQLQSVANGVGLGLVPQPALDASPLRDALQVVPFSDFKPQIDLWSVWRPGSPRLATLALALGASASAHLARFAQESQAAEA